MNSATRPPDKCLMVLRPVSDPRVVTRDGAGLFGIDANCDEPLSQGGLPLRAIWHNGQAPKPSVMARHRSRAVWVSFGVWGRWRASFRIGGEKGGSRFLDNRGHRMLS